ncbi:MAG: CapA family protein [Clostridia bacterium]|nr:CapA family protein [Clostridia bacterium]
MKKQAYKRIGCVIFMTLMLMLLSFFPQSGQEHTSFAEAQPEEEVADLNIQKLELKDLSQERRIFISSPDEVVGFSANEFVIDVRTEGTITFLVSDTDGNVRYADSMKVVAGKNILVWNGAGSFGQPLASAAYDLSFVFRAVDGTCTEAREVCTLSKNLQSVLYAVPSSEILYLNDGEMWSVDCALAQAGNIVMDIFSDDEQRTLLARVSQQVKKETNARLVWNGRQNNGRFVSGGKYLVSVYAEGNGKAFPDISVFVQDSKNSDQYDLSIGVTGSIVPRRNMSDTEIWEIMMQPSVVYNGAEAVYVKEKPSMRSASAGKINPQKQALEVLEVGTDGWTKVRAWRQEDGKLIEGYLLTASLKVVMPDNQYGLLVDKKEQRLYVYEYGKRIAEATVSTGLVKYGQSAWETPAGSFLTGLHLGPAGMDGKTYEYRISYDGTRTIEQIGYQTIRGKIIYTDTETLGEKATRGCIAIPADGALKVNAWWLYTHLRAGTRVVIIDEEMQPVNTYIACETYQGSSDIEIAVTICGDAEIGKNEHLQDNWKVDERLFSHLKNLLLHDDLSILCLASVLSEEHQSLYTTRADAIKARTETIQYMQNAGVDLVTLSSRHFSDYGYQGRISTLKALKKNGVSVAGAGSVFVLEKQGVILGVLSERESSYIENPELLLQDIQTLKAMKCDAIIAMCSWGTESASWHTDRQEKMAHYLVESGVDLIVGQGGRIQGLSLIQEKPVIWNLGRLIICENHPRSLYGMAAQITFHFSASNYEGVDIHLLPLAVSSKAEEGINDHQPVLLNGAQAEMVLSMAQNYSDIFLSNTMWFPNRLVESENEQEKRST